MSVARAHVCRMIDQHFALSLPPAESRFMRQHLQQCRTCAAYYERRLFMSRLQPNAPDFKTRLRVELGLDDDEERQRAPRGRQGEGRRGEDRAGARPAAPRSAPRGH